MTVPKRLILALYRQSGGTIGTETLTISGSGTLNLAGAGSRTIASEGTLALEMVQMEE